MVKNNVTVVDDIFENNLFFLLPFYIFNLESKLDDYESDEVELIELEQILCGIIERLEKVEETVLSLRSKGVIIKQMGSVAGKLSEKRDRVNERIGDIMGGQVIKMEWLERYDAAVAKGKEEGRAEERENNRVRLICKKLRKNKDIPQIADELEEDVEDIKPICDIAADFAPEYDEEKVIEAVRKKCLTPV